MNNAWSEMVTLTLALLFIAPFHLGSYNGYGISQIPLPTKHMEIFQPYSFVEL